MGILGISLVPLPKARRNLHWTCRLSFFRRAYDSGPYARGAVDYDGPPDPPLRPELAEWLNCLKRS